MIAGRYTLVREIGRGGTGVVWLGEDQVLGRQVALKRIGLLPGADSTDIARAEREARLSARLNHPHVVAVFNLVVDAETDAQWLVMEYVAGTNLSELIRRDGPLTPDAAAPLLLQAADALVAAHAAGIVHRDVKPSNILVDDQGQVKLTDFGIARVAADPALTQTGLVTGSPAYLAPEVATGGRGGAAADVWSLGATLFHVLAGRPPYDTGDHVLSTLYRIVNEEPPRLPDAGWLAPLLEATMVRDPAERWSITQVRDFLADPPDHPAGDGTRVLPPLAAAAPRAPLPPEPTPAEVVPAAEPRRHRLGWLLGALAVLVVLAVVAYAALHRSPSTPNVAAKSPTNTPSSHSSTPSPTPSPTPSQTTPAAPKPTSAGMKAFIGRYVAAVGTDPHVSWQMLTPNFQRASGGLSKYLSFWSGARNGRVLGITADPKALVVAYQVHFDNFHNGPGPTVLSLKFVNGQYKIDAEHTKGFHPAH